MRAFRFLLITGFFVSLMLPTQGYSMDIMDMEALINERFADLPLTPDNRHRLAAWSELKGDFSSTSDRLTLHFGKIGKLEVYPNNFLLRIGHRRIYHLDRRSMNDRDILIMNETLADVFEQISLLANHNADPELVYFVDEQLARKNIEPFAKVYLRHILIRFGRFDPIRRIVQFKTDWLPINSFEYEVPGENGSHFVRRPIDPLYIKLDESTVRGYYLRSGGTVYVEDVERNVFYATGHGYSPNVSAFKIFLQKLFTQTTTYVVREEEQRIVEYQRHQHHAQRHERQRTSSETSRNMFSRGSTRAHHSRSGAGPSYKPLYSQNEWMGKMLGLLRLQDAVTDPDVAEFLVSQSFFSELYKQLNDREQDYYDQLQGSTW